MRKSAHGILMHAALQALFIAACGYALAADRADLGKMQEQMLAPDVQLNRSCSASFIHSARDPRSGDVETLLLTARHCVDGQSKRHQIIYAPIYQGNRLVEERALIASVIGADWASDTALLKLHDTDTLFEKLVTLAPERPILFEGEDVWAVGWALAKTRVVTEGTFGNLDILNLINEAEDIEYYRATTQIAGGNSGGALFHKTDKGDYEQIGLATASNRQHDFLTLWTPIQAIRKYIMTKAPQVFGEKPKSISDKGV
jgi:S1-C subfamily serine protease